MKKLFAMGLVLCLLLTSLAFGVSPQPPENNNDAVNNELIVSVEFSEQRTLRTMDDMEGFSVKDAFWDDFYADEPADLKADPAKEKMGDIFLITYSKNLYKNFDEAKAALEKELEALGYKVNYIEPNNPVKLFDPLPQVQREIPDKQKWHYEMIKVPQAWKTTTGSKDVKIAVIDSGIDASHKDLKQNVDASLGKNFTSDDATDTMDGLGHGTHVAGTIAANGNLTGIMQKATVFPVRVFNDYGSSNVYWIIKGIVFAADQGADVINMSFRTRPSKGAEDACNYAVSKGAVPVAASGNDGRDGIRYPARYDSVIAVGSVDSNKSRSYFSNYGDGLELMAPGSDIISTTPGNGEDKYSGTSMATPHVTGVVGLMLSVKPDASLKEIREALTNTAEKIGDAKEYGHGLVNSEAAVKALVTS